MTSQLTSQLEARNKKFNTTIRDNIDICRSTPFGKDRLSTIYDTYSHLMSDTFWISHEKFKTLVPLVIEKALEFKEEAKKYDLPREESNKYYGVMDDALRLFKCNKRVKDRFCNRKRGGDKYCSFHLNLKAKFDKAVSTELRKFMCKDVANIVVSYMEF